MILALDCSTPVLSLAVGELRGELLHWIAERDIPGGSQHGAALPLAFDEILAAAGVALDGLSGAAVGLGPGSFTGVRVGIGTLKGVCYARRIPLAGASSLRAIALEALRLEPSGGRLCALLDARHGELYAGVFAGPTAEPIGAEVSLRPEALREFLRGQEDVPLAGDGVRAYRAILERDFSPDRLRDLPSHPRARAVGELSLPLPAFSLPSLFAVQPHYVRASEPEIRFPEGSFKARDV